MPRRLGAPDWLRSNTFPPSDYPQTEIIESLATWFADGTLSGKFVTMDSEHSMVTAAGAAAATGVRTFTATSSQGLVYAMEALYTVSGWRVPFVLVNVSRGLSSPSPWGPITMMCWRHAMPDLSRFM